MKVLVTGGAGFIGSHVCDALLARGDEVVCLDNFNDYYDPEYKNNNIAHNQDNPRFVLCREDILDLTTLRRVFAEHSPSRVVHLAARAGVRPSLADPHLYQDVNVRGTLNLLDCTREYAVENFVFASSSSVYGVNKKVPFAETDPVDNPISPYAATKKAAELLCHTYHHLYGLPVSCLRFFTAYGPRGRPDMAPYLFTRLITAGKAIKVFGDGSSQRDYTYISDIVAGVLAALDRPHPFMIFNLGNSETVALHRLIGVIEERVGRQAKKEFTTQQPGDVVITYADITKARELLGFAPAVDIATGIDRFVTWYEENRR